MIITDRLHLRPFEIGDAGWVTEHIRVPEVHTWLTRVPRPYTLDDGEGFVATHAGNPTMRVILHDGDPVGVVTLMGEGIPDLGYWLKTAAWGQGLMTEAARALLDWHFAQGGGEVQSGWIRGNAGSEKVLRKLGFQDAGSRWAPSLFRGEEVEVIRVSLTPPGCDEVGPDGGSAPVA